MSEEMIDVLIIGVDIFDFEDLVREGEEDNTCYLTLQRLFQNHAYEKECTTITKSYYEHVKNVIFEFHKIQKDLNEKYEVQYEKFKIKDMLERKNDLSLKVEDMKKQILALDEEIIKRVGK